MLLRVEWKVGMGLDRMTIPPIMRELGLFLVILPMQV